MAIIKYRFYIILSIILLLTFNINSIQVSALNTDNSKKTVYLTFDDGPSINVTRDIIQILNNNDIKGTFFVVGDSASIYPYLLSELDENEMCIMPHCNIHDYISIYKTEEQYFKDLEKCKENIRAIIGDREMNFIRMPGGADNEICSEEVLSKIKGKIIESGANYIDWTIAVGDTESEEVSADFLKSRVRDEGCLYEVEVVLMHDLGGKRVTVEALQDIINIYKERGYTFKALDEIEPWEMQYLKEINVINKGWL